MRSLLLFAATGYFFAALHIHEHIAEDLAHLQVHPKAVAAEHGETGYSVVEHHHETPCDGTGHFEHKHEHEPHPADHEAHDDQHECLICTVQSHFIALLPPDNTSYVIAEIGSNNAFAYLSTCHNNATLNPLKARAPPIS